LLLKLKERFSMIPLKVVFKLRGGYAIRWYELLVAKKHLGTFSMSVEDLRSWLEIGDGELSAVKDLRKRAIDVSKAELDNKADLTFRYEAIKAGRRITGWTFKVKGKPSASGSERIPATGGPRVKPSTDRRGEGGVVVYRSCIERQLEAIQKPAKQKRPLKQPPQEEPLPTYEQRTAMLAELKAAL
jgi:hypothetical protein